MCELNLYLLSTQKLTKGNCTELPSCQAETVTTDQAGKKGGFDLFTVYSSKNKLNETKADLQFVCWVLGQ